jgi:hypothetical protein
MAQDTTPERDPIEEYWAAYGTASPCAYGKYPFRFIDNSRPTQPLLPLDLPREPDGWTSGRYAFAALVWGLIFMLLISLEAGI